VRLFRRQIVFGKDRALCAEVGAIAAIDALVRIDEHLGNSSGRRITRRRRNRGGGTICYAYKIQRAGIGNDISHNKKLLDWFWDCFWALCDASFPLKLPSLVLAYHDPNHGEKKSGGIYLITVCS
jgi:hypothetical protein